MTWWGFASNRLRGISIASSAVKYTVRAYFRSANGRTQPLSLVATTNSDRTTAIADSIDALAIDGELVGLIVGTETTDIKRGQCYLSVSLLDGSSASALCRGYIYDGHGLALGEFAEPGPGGGEGNIRNVVTDNPAANTQHAGLVVPTNAVWRIISYDEVVTTFTAAAKSISIRDDVGPGFSVIGQSDEATPSAAAGRIIAYIGAPTAFDTVLNAFVFPLAKDHFLREAEEMQIVLNGIAATDDLAAGNTVVEEWLVI